MKKYKTTYIAFPILIIGLIVGYYAGTYKASILQPTKVNVYISGYASAYGALINLTEKNTDLPRS